MAEEEINRLEDGPFAVELRESIVSIRDKMAEAKSAAQEDASRVMSVVTKSQLWMLEKLATINLCGVRLWENVGDVAAFTVQYTYPNLVKWHSRTLRAG